MSEVSIVEMQGRLTAAIGQRNDALDRCVLMQGTIAALEADLKARSLIQPTPPIPSAPKKGKKKD